MTPTNDIERLLENRRFGKHDYPELFRLLRESDLIFLIPKDPERSGVIQWREEDGVPPFAPWETLRTGKNIPVFSSTEAARRACRQIGAWNHFSFCQIKGRKLFELLSQQEESFEINPACSAFRIHFGASHAKELADGSILKPRKNDDVEGTLTPVKPEDYPSDFMNAMFEFFRKTEAVHAAWIFKDIDAKEKEICYVFLLDVPKDARKVEKDFCLIADLACPKNAEWGVQILDRTNMHLAAASVAFQPFYTTADYKPFVNRRE